MDKSKRMTEYAYILLADNQRAYSRSNPILCNIFWKFEQTNTSIFEVGVQRQNAATSYLRVGSQRVKKGKVHK